MLLFLVTGGNCIAAAIDVQCVHTAMAEYTADIENGNFSEKTVSAVKEDAKKRGYETDITIYDADRDGYSDLARMSIQYGYTMPFFKETETRHTVVGYAR